MKAIFSRKACNVSELIPLGNASSQFAVVDVVELKPADYDQFTRNLLTDYDFIAVRKDKMFTDQNGVRHCILVKMIEAPSGILVESEGYDYARYSALYPGDESLK